MYLTNVAMFGLEEVTSKLRRFNDNYGDLCCGLIAGKGSVKT